jgi:hypothetical protein
MHAHLKYKYKLKCLYGENSKTGSVKVPVKFFGRSAAVKVTFRPKKYFYEAPKNGARGAVKVTFPLRIFAGINI